MQDKENLGTILKAAKEHVVIEEDISLDTENYKKIENIQSEYVEQIEREKTLFEAEESQRKFEQNINEVIEEEQDDARILNRFEKIYGSAVKRFFKIANPFKKFAFKTQCLMHRFINIQAIHILENEGYKIEANFFRQNIRAINEGATWIDQDFKSINHFFHYADNDGIFGFSDALTEAKFYEDKLIKFAQSGNKTKSLFYLGVILHLSQDMTVPQHVNKRLLDAHRDYEQWILRKAWSEIDYRAGKGIVRLRNLKDYFKENAKYTNDAYVRLNTREKGEEVYEELSKDLVYRAQRSTAGILLDYYMNVYKIFDYEKKELITITPKNAVNIN